MPPALQQYHADRIAAATATMLERRSDEWVVAHNARGGAAAVKKAGGGAARKEAMSTYNARSRPGKLVDHRAAAAAAVGAPGAAPATAAAPAAAPKVCKQCSAALAKSGTPIAEMAPGVRPPAAAEWVWVWLCR